MAGLARTKPHVIREFVFDVYGWSGNDQELTDLPGWPRSMQSITAMELARSSEGTITVRCSGEHRELRLKDACKVLNILRDNNLGYYAIITPMFAYERGSATLIYAWLFSPNSRPRVLKRFTRTWVAATQDLLGAELVDMEPPELYGDIEVLREVNKAFKHKSQLSQLAALDQSLGG